MSSFLKRLHHVGIVVESIEQALPGYLRSLDGRAVTDIIHDPLQKVKVLFIRTSPGEDPSSLIELVEPAGNDSPVLQFLQKKGGGLHHLCYEVEDIDDAVAQLKQRSALIVSRPKPAVAFEGRRVAWAMTKEWLLVEVLERESPKL